MQESASPPESIVYHLTEQDEGLTLAAALKAHCEESSWGVIKRWISKRQVQVNGNLCLDEARRVAQKDVIKVWRTSLPKPVEASDLRVQYLDEHLVVLCKPAAITSVRHFAERKLSTRRRQLQPTVEELLPMVLAKLLKLRWPPLPPKGMNRGRKRTNAQQRGKIQNAKKLPPELQIFPVHRLDRDTSGLMLFARTKPCEQRLIHMFRRHRVDREYVAFCQGKVEPQTFESHLARDRGDGLRGSVPENQLETQMKEQDGPQILSATTHVVASQEIHDREGRVYSQLRCKLETGRTHQIRIHLAEAGHPICGDKIYHQQLDGPDYVDHSGAPRHALHSDRLKLQHPVTGEQLEFHMPLPKDLTRWLQQLSTKTDKDGNKD